MKAARRKNRRQSRRQKLKKSIGGYVFIALVLLAMVLTEVTLERCDALQQCVPKDWEPISGAEQVPVGGLQIHCIDTGQGSCTLVRSSEACVLIDAGGTADEDVPADYLRKLGVERLEWVICTHLHKDHINAMDEVVRSIPIENIVLGEVPAGLETDYDTYTLTREIERSGLTVANVQQGDVLCAGDMTITVLAPLPPEPEDPPVTDLNDCSIALRIECGGISVFVAGDINSRVEKKLVEKGLIKPCTVYCASHHGSSLSSCEGLLDALQPQYCCISCGKYNDYNHPGDALLRRLDERRIPVLRTDRSGTIVLTFPGEGQEAAAAA